MAVPAVNSPLFRRDVMHRVVLGALGAPHFPHAKLEEVLRADRDANAPLPSLTPEERHAVDEAAKALALYCATDACGEGEGKKKEALQWQYTHAGCMILQCDLGAAQRQLEQLARALRPPRARPGMTSTQSRDAMELNMAVLGTLQWLSAAQRHVQNAERYQRWRADMLKKLAHG